jgi:3-oxoacyl-[acyl-carrier protein] reductase
VSERRILVTGGSRGLGLGFCTHYLAGGDRVVACARTGSDAAGELEARHGDRFAFVALDLLEPDAPRALVAAAVDRLGGIDVLVNNAAIGQDSLLAHTSDEEIARIVALNLTATILLTRLVVRRMLLDGGGAVLNVSSIGGLRGYAGLSVYSATKGGLDAFTRSLAAELGPSGIRVNGVAPGFFQSEMSALLGADEVETIRRRTPTRALPTPEQVVRACDVLVAPDANVTGHVLVVDGGASVA